MEIDWSQEIGFDPNGTYEFPDEDGVYVIAEVTDRFSNVCYVGQGNIYERMKYHKDWQNDQNECLAKVMKDTGNVKVRSAIIPNQIDRDDIEYTYYNHYLYEQHSLCNKITPVGKHLEGIKLPF